MKKFEADFFPRVAGTDRLSRIPSLAQQTKENDGF